MAAPVITHGSKIGMHAIRPNQAVPLVRQAHARGVVWPLVKAVDNGGIPIDVKAIEPKTLTILRFVNLAEDAAQDVVQWTSADMRAHARRALDFVWLRLNAQERAAADWIEPINEADPPGVEGWRAFGQYLSIMVDEGNQRGMKLALPAFNAGTPEWAETQALVSTGLFGLMKAGGHLLTAHEGVFGAQPVGEFYAGGSYTLPPAEQVARFAWYDQQARRDPYVLAVLPFTLDPDDTWRASDYTPASTQRVKAIQLNIREFPFVGQLPPPIVGTLDQGAVITVLGVYQPAGQAFGWGCLSPDGNQWVSLQWVDAIK
jgi:hypothetical protein